MGNPFVYYRLDSVKELKRYLALIEEVEKYVRYEPDNPTYIRNAIDSRKMYDMAFKLL